MSAQILSGKVFATKFKEEAKQEAEKIYQQYGIKPGLAVIIVGENSASQVYVRNKHRTCEELGFYSEVVAMPEATTKEALIAKIQELNHDEKIHGILVQLPLPKGSSTRQAHSASTNSHRRKVLDMKDPPFSFFFPSSISCDAAYMQAK